MFGGPSKTRKSQPRMELVRLAIPRRVYTQSHIDYVIEAALEVFHSGRSCAACGSWRSRPALRHFTAEFAEV